VIASLLKNKSLRHLYLNNTTESFYYALREKMPEKENCPKSLKLSFTKFVQERHSSDKKSTDENCNTENAQSKMNEYSKRVREINKQGQTRKISKQLTFKGVETVKPNQEARQRQPLVSNKSNIPEEESEISEMTDDVTTSYYKHRTQSSMAYR